MLVASICAITIGALTGVAAFTDRAKNNAFHEWFQAECDCANSLNDALEDMVDELDFEDSDE